MSFTWSEDDLAQLVDAMCHGGLPAKGAEVRLRAVLPEEGTVSRASDHLARLVEREPAGAETRGGAQAGDPEREPEEEAGDQADPTDRVLGTSRSDQGAHYSEGKERRQDQ